MVKHLISVKDFGKKEVGELIVECKKLKENQKKYSDSLKNKTVLMLFEKPSTRTRVSFEAGITRLGGHAIYFDPKVSQISRGETLEDTAKTLSRYIDCLVARVYKHESLLMFAKYARIPIVNGLSDKEHPCQALGDAFTMKEKNKLGGRIVYVGDGNNVANSLALLADTLNLDFTVSCPKGYEPQLGKPRIEYDPKKAVSGADVIYTDVWVSMGDEKEEEKRVKDLEKYQVNSELLSNARKDCIVMHCLPAHRGQEITDDVMDSRNSVVFDQAENRMHMQNAILLKLLGQK